MKIPQVYAFSTFVCGLAVMAMELSASRLLAPFFGNSLYVWTNLISSVLVALSFGYVWGGRLADRRPDSTLYFGMIGIAGLWTVLVPFLAPFVFDFILNASPNLAWTTRFGSLIAIALLFSLPVFVLGMIVPFTLKLSLDQLKGVGHVSGQLSMISTVGSLLGSFLPAFVFLPVLGTTRTFVFLGLVLCLLSAFGLRRKWRVLFSFLGFGLLWFAPSIDLNVNVVDAVDSPYGFVFITEDEEGVRRLHVDTSLGTQSLYHPETILMDERYYYSYFGVLPGLVEAPQKVLILGHAGGSFTRLFNAYFPSLKLTGVELDPMVTDLSKKYMGLEGAEVEIVHSDARAYLLSTEERFDLILVDTYHGVNIPAHLATEEFFALCAQHLEAEGVLALNAASIEGLFLNRLSNTVASALGSVWVVPIPSSFNFMLVAQADGVYELMNTLPSDLQVKWTTLQREEPFVASFDSSLGTFKDDRLSEVEVLNEEMFMQLLTAF